MKPLSKTGHAKPKVVTQERMHIRGQASSARLVPWVAANLTLAGPQYGGRQPRFMNKATCDAESGTGDHDFPLL